MNTNTPTEGSKNFLLEAALAYARRGRFVFPVIPKRKEPLTRNGHLDATTDEAVIKMWWRDNPDANVAMHCERSGVVVFDADRHPGKPDGVKALKEILDDSCDLLDTLKSATPQNGEHYFFNAPPGTKFKKQLTEGIDIKYNGYVVLPPSVVNFKPDDESQIVGSYEWQNNHALAELPQELLDLAVLPGEQKSLGELRAEALEDDTESTRNRYAQWIVNGGHQQNAYTVANQGKDYGLRPESVVQIMLQVCNRFWENPITEEAAWKRVNNAFKYGQNSQGCKSLQNEFADEIIAIQNQSELAHEANVNPWPVLSDQAFYGIAGDIVRAATEESEADPAAVLITTLAWAGATFGDNCYVGVGETRHPPRLMAAIVGASSRARKGTSANPVERIFKRAEESCIWDEGRCIPSLQVKPGPLSSGEGLVFAVRDGTPEDLGVSDKRLLVVEGELAAALKAMQREGNTLSAIVRLAWDHGNIAPLTKTNPTQATGAHVCVVGHITRHELNKLLLQSADVWNGFANRFIWVCARRQKSVPVPKPMPDAVVIDIAKRLAKTVIHAREMKRVDLAPETEAVWTDVYPRLTEDESGTFGAVIARAEAQVLRIALIFALLDMSAEIRPEQIYAALAVWKYCRESARFIFGQAESNPVAAKILSALKEGEKTQTELNKLFSGHTSSNQLKSTLADLQAVGRITQRREGGGNGKGKPTIYWSQRPGFNCSDAELADFEE